jgi:hypothetical protein
MDHIKKSIIGSIEVPIDRAYPDSNLVIFDTKPLIFRGVAELQREIKQK